MICSLKKCITVATTRKLQGSVSDIGLVEAFDAVAANSVVRGS